MCKAHCQRSIRAGIQLYFNYNKNFDFYFFYISQFFTTFVVTAGFEPTKTHANEFTVHLL